MEVKSKQAREETGGVPTRLFCILRRGAMLPMIRIDA